MNEKEDNKKQDEDKEESLTEIEHEAEEAEKGERTIKKVKYFIYFSVFVILSALTFYYLYNIFDKPAKIFVFRSFSIPILSSLLLLLLAYFIFDGLRLYYILKTLKCEINFLSIFKLVFINIFISNVTPMATGGGFIQVYFLNKKGISLGDATAATTIRTVIATVTVFITAPLVFFTRDTIQSGLALNRIIFYMTLFAIIYFSFFYIVIFRNKLIKRVVYNILIFLRHKNLMSHKRFKNISRFLFKEINIFGKGLSSFFKGKKLYVFLSLFFAILFLLAELSFTVLLMMGMSYEPAYWPVVLSQLVVLFFMYFAPTPGATGIAEGGFSLVFANYVQKTDMFPLIFNWRFFTKYIGIIIGVILFFSAFFGKKDTSI